MKEVVNDVIPVGYASSMTVWPLLFVRRKYMERLAQFPELLERMRRHEAVHGEQQKEMLCAAVALAALLLLVGCGWWSLLALPLFFWWYGAEWIVRSIQFRSFHVGYRNISYEREAYYFQDDVGYLERRRRWSWIRWLRQPK